MNAKPMLVAAASALVVAGCATGGFHPTGMHQICRGHGLCEIPVTVNACGIAVPDTIDLYDGAKEIHWDIQTPGYSFPENGIVIKEDPGGSVSQLQRLSATKFKLHDDNVPQPKPISYGINVLNGSMACPQRDPWIVNHG
ncbi:MAG TPA: hypothetical protein VKV24_01600 [Casimicrobiaceae bacterium]|nr:hypothetical protein [Casimicrobiaceae bacterium]